MSRPSKGILVFFISFFYLLVGSNLHIEYLDDGAASYGALRVLSGDIPYRDFVTVSTPAHFYALAALFKFFGPDLLVERVWQCLIWASATTVVYAVTALATSTPLGLVSALMSLAVIGRFPHVAGALPSAVLFSFLAVYLCLKGLSARRGIYHVVAGIFTAFAALFRQDFGVYTFLSIFSVLALCHDPEKRQRGDMRRFLAGFAAGMAGPAAYFLINAPLGEMFFDLVWFPLRIYPPFAFLPYPRIFSGAQNIFSDKVFYFYFTPMVLIFSILYMLAGWHRPKESSGHWTRFWPKLILIILGCLFLSQAKLRPSPVHLLPAYLVSTALFSMILASIIERKKYVLLVLVGILTATFLAPGVFSRGSLFIFKKEVVHLDMERSRHIGLFLKSQTRELYDYEAAVNYTRSIISPDEKIFVGSVRHDRVCYSDPLFYFLSFSKSATRYHEMPRGMVNQENVQREIVDELERGKIRVVVLRKLLDDRCAGEPNASRKTDGAQVLDSYLQEYYVSEKEFGGNMVFRRREQ